MAASKLSTNAHLLETAQSNRISFGDGFVSARMTQLIGAHADAIGVPLEFIFWPLLTAVASFIGTNGHIRINSEWVEPSIMWFVIAAKKGEKKTAALRRIRKPVEEIERDLIGEWGSAQRSNDDKSVPPQLIVDHFSFEELHSIMSRNNGQILGCFDEMSTLYGQLDLYKHASTMDRKTLLTLNGGGAWARNFKSYTGRISKTAFNITGFIQPTFVFEMLNSDDADGLNDRQLFDFPPERELLLNELVVPMPADTPDLKSILNAVRLAHVSAEMYTLEGEAYELFRMCHDELVQEKQKTKDENVQGILSKARGYLARIALIVHCLEQAIVNTDREDDECPPWSTNVSPKAVEAAICIIKHFNTQKFIALGFGDGDVTSPTKTAFVNNRVARLLSMHSKYGDGILHLSDVCQKHISEKVGSSYPVSKATELVNTAAHLGFGEVIEVSTPNRRAITRFRKRKLSDLSENCRKMLKTANISDNKYRTAFDISASSSVLADIENQLPT